ncbi:MAG: hypothetical protein KIT84_06400 [Labilithrix sp.]|nr:hypothetical protein [Labilithrix sp.]MCW5810623.1 hypothetical protein [Labilithrix sp.]
MKRAAIVGALSCFALVVSCTDDFDALFAAEEEELDDPKKEDPDDVKPSPSSGSSSGGVVEPLACGKPVTTCETTEQPGDFETKLTCSGCGCSCGTLECTNGEDCTLACVGGSNCSALCDDHDRCTFLFEGGTAKARCSSITCDVDCRNGATCNVDCSDTGACIVVADATSTAVVTCSPKSDDTCSVTCAKGDAKKCANGTRTCGECPG